MSPDKATVASNETEEFETPVPHDSGSVKTNSEPASETIEKNSPTRDVVPAEGVHSIVVPS